MLSALRLWWHSWNTRRKMDRVFSRGEDPYGYRSSPYELARLAAMERALSGRRWARVLEVGCAEGVFTRRLAALAGSVTAVDVSRVALDRAAARAAAPAMAFVEADIRRWEPPAGTLFDAIVLADILYYLDKPLVQEEFGRTFGRVASWLEPAGRLVLAHGFAGAAEKTLREDYRARFQGLGFGLVEEIVVGEGEAQGKVCCLLSVLEKRRRRHMTPDALP